MAGEHLAISALGDNMDPAHAAISDVCLKLLLTERHCKH